jgi:hypothetical protein
MVFIFLVFGGIGVWIQGLMPARQVFYHLSHSTSPFFVMGSFQDRVSQTTFLDWLWTTILLISASWVTTITGVSHQHSASYGNSLFNILIDKSLNCSATTTPTMHKFPISLHPYQTFQFLKIIWPSYWIWSGISWFWFAFS